MVASLGVFVTLAACGPANDVEEDAEDPSASLVEEAPQELDPPAVPGSLAPHLVVADGRVLLSWLEPAEELATGSGHRLRFAELAGNSWSAARTVAEGSDFFANWADVPSVVPLPDGALLAHWLAKVGGGTYAYSIRLAVSSDGGESWSDLGFLPDDESPTEHGFAALIPDGDAVQAFWLDGRRMAADGPMELRTARLSGPTIERGAETVVDDRVCECCPLDAVTTATGPVVVYRDRSAEEIRNIRLVRKIGETWSAPITVHDDGWKIPGCPVNGPAVAAAGDRLAVAWFTAPDETPMVRLAFSEDGGATFAAPFDVDIAAPTGRVGLILDAGDAVVSWLAADEEGASLQVQRYAPSGPLGPPIQVATTTSSRRSGFPRIATDGTHLFLAWVEVPTEGPQRLRLMRRTIPR